MASGEKVCDAGKNFIPMFLVGWFLSLCGVRKNLFLTYFLSKMYRKVQIEVCNLFFQKVHRGRRVRERKREVKVAPNRVAISPQALKKV
jgi:hypothetical protein